MLRSEPRLSQDVLDELDRLDAALHADRHGANDGSADPFGDASSDHPDGGTTADDRTDASAGPSAGDADDDLDRELLALVADVRTVRPEFDPGTRMRLEVRVQDAKATPAPRTRRFTADRRWRAGLALAAVAAVAIPVGGVRLDGRNGSDGDVVAEMTVRPTSGAPSSSSGSATTESLSDAGDARSDEESLSSTSRSRSGAGDLEDLARRPSPTVVPESSTSDSASRSSGSTASPPEPPVTRQAPLGAPRQVIRDVEQTVRINPGDVATSAERVTTIVQDAGGYLGSSEVRERGSAAGGTFQVVVPTGRLDATVAALSKIGRPVRLERSSSDVTDQATSLDDQLQDLRADRAAARLALARTVDPAKRAARRRELTLLSSRVAGLQGQRDQLRRQTSTSRIDLRLTTSRSASDDAAPPVDDGSWGIGDAWDDAGRVLEVGGGVVLIGGVVLVPLAGVLGLGLVLRRRAAARVRERTIDAA